jgi:hypothetical protein
VQGDAPWYPGKERFSMENFLGNFFTDFIGRFDGPLHFRLYVQPLMAILFAIRDGSRDAREARSAYGWALLNDPAHRQYLLESGWKGIWKVFIFAYALDVVYQVIAWRGLRPFEALLTAVILAVVPYALLRGPANRLLRSHQARRSHV